MVGWMDERAASRTGEWVYIDECQDRFAAANMYSSSGQLLTMDREN